MVAMVTITYLSGPRKGESVSFNQNSHPEIAIGRDKGNQIVFEGQDYRSVSRKHSSIAIGGERESGPSTQIVDHSTNGTYVNGNKLSNAPLELSDGDILSFTASGQDLRIEIKNEVQNNVDLDETSASFTKIVPTTNPGFLKEVTDETFFMPAITTVIAAVCLFWAIDTSFMIYTNILGIYLGLMTLFFVRSVTGMNLPLWLMIGTTFTTIILFYLYIPWLVLELIFRPPAIKTFMESKIFLQEFIGYFVAAGLLEELFKAIPVFAFIALNQNFQNLNLPGLKRGKVSPVLTVLIGVSSAVGFIIVETLYDYVPKFSAEYGEVVGLALLIPRFISGIAGHVGFSGIFSYFIGLAFYYKTFNLKLLLIGWVLSSVLHGLWNSSPNFIISSVVALSTFTIFMVYLMKAKKSFPT